MINFSKLTTQDAYFTGNNSELLVSYNVSDENKNYEFDNVVFGYIANGMKKILIPETPCVDLYPGMVIMGTTKLSAHVSLPEASIKQPMTCFSLEVSKEKVWKVLDKINENYHIPELVKSEQTLETTSLYFGQGGAMVLDTLTKIQDLLVQDVAFKDYWIDLKIEELVLYCLQTNMRNTLIHSYQQNKMLDHPLAYAIKYIKEHLYEKIDIKTLADKAYMSKSTFFRQFKHNFGMTPISYINTERMKEAQMLLEKTDKTIREIGYGLGYTSASYFSAQFERVIGCSPKEFRKEKS